MINKALLVKEDQDDDEDRVVLDQFAPSVTGVGQLLRTGVLKANQRSH